MLYSDGALLKVSVDQACKPRILGHVNVLEFTHASNSLMAYVMDQTIMKQDQKSVA